MKRCMTEDEHTSTMLRYCNTASIMDILFKTEAAWALFDKIVPDYAWDDFFLCNDGYSFHCSDPSYGTDSGVFVGVYL